MILYVVLAAAPPFRESALEQSLENVKFNFRAPVWGSVSEAAKDLIKSLLNPDPNSRFSCDEALSHRWFAGFVDVRGCVALFAVSVTLYVMMIMLCCADAAAGHHVRHGGRHRRSGRGVAACLCRESVCALLRGLRCSGRPCQWWRSGCGGQQRGCRACR